MSQIKHFKHFKYCQRTRGFVSPKRAFLMYILVSLFLFFEMALQVSPSVMASQLMHSLSIGAFGLGIMSGCYFYTYTVMQIPSGQLLDRFNPRLIITLSICICSLGAICLSLSTDLIFAIFSRLLMGIGSAFAFVSVLVVTRDLFDSKHFATLTGVTQALAALGAMSGQLPVSHLVSYFGWIKSMQIFALIGFIIAISVFIFLRYNPPRLYSCIQNRLPSKALKSILSNPQTWFVALYACLLWMPMSGFASLWGVPFLEHYESLSSHQAAFLCSLMWLGLAIFSPLVGFLSTLIKSRKQPLIFTALLGSVAFGCLLFLKLNTIEIGLCIFLAGAACAGQALSFTVVKENNPEYSQATALAINNMAVVISGALIQPVIGGLIELFEKSQKIILHPYHMALFIILGAYLLAFIIGLWGIKRPQLPKPI